MTASLDIERVWCLWGLFALIALKLGLAAAIGPLYQPDSEGYIAFADQILKGSDWFSHQPGAGGDASYRMAGYPLLIAAAKMLLGRLWPYGLLALQAALSVTATVALYRFCRRFFSHWIWAFVCCAGFATSQAVIFDLMILTDGIYGSLVLLAAALLGLAAFVRQSSRYLIWASGITLAGAFLIRESTQILIVGFLPLLFVAARAQKKGALAPLALAAGFAAPLFIVAAGYMTWNEYRSDAAFITTGMRTAALLPLVRIAGEGYPVFDGDSPLDDTVRQTARDFTYDDVLRINTALVASGMSAIEVDRAARAKFWQTLWRFPGGFTRYALGELHPVLRMLALFNPVRTAIHLKEFVVEGSLGGFERRARTAVGDRNLGKLALVAAEVASSFLSVCFGALAYAVFPMQYVTRRRTERRTLRWQLLACAWLLYFSFIGAYSVIRIEDRYLIGVAPMALLVAIAVIEAFLRRSSAQASRAA